MMRGNRPAIYQLGRVHEDGDQVVISGWGIGLCATNCPCHKHPWTGHLVIAQDQDNGTLGLASYPAETPSAGPPCPCCQPWTHEELAQVVRDLADIEALQYQPPAAPPAAHA